MARHIFFCIDGHTCGNPVRLVAGGGPNLEGATMIEKRAHFLAEFDWIRTGLMFEPRGHDMMSGSILYPPTRDDCDIAILFIETSGCLPMCGHGTIGTVTMAIEHGLVSRRRPACCASTRRPAWWSPSTGRTASMWRRCGITNVASFLHSRGLDGRMSRAGRLSVDVAYGGNFYAIVEPQANFPDIADFTAARPFAAEPGAAPRLNERYEFVHPEKPEIRGLSHILWTGAPKDAQAHARNAVFYGDKAIDRSPCGTGTSARMAQWAARGRLERGRRIHP